MKKNITPRQLAFLSAVSISVIVLLVHLLFVGITNFSTNFAYTIGIALTVFVPTYLIVFFLLKHYLYRKIKLIYKSIHSEKTNRSFKMENMDYSKDIIEEAEKEVKMWASKQQKEIENLKSLEEYRRNLLGDISHELKTPLFNIQGYIHTLLDGALYDEKINEEYLRRAAINAERLHHIVEDLEVISRLESGENPLEIETFNLLKLCNEVIEETDLVAKKKKITIVYKDKATQPYEVSADRESVRQIMTNLIVNSIKYGKKKGTTKIAFYDMDEYILVEVADNGIGIDQKHLAHIFDRFYRVEKSRNRSKGGSGLGLSIVKHIIEAHGTTINVRSNPDVGTTFGFTLKKP